MGPHKACNSCRSLKIKCVWQDSDSGVCERCVRFKRTCVVSASQKRRQPRTANVRVAELEKEVEALRSALHATGLRSGSETASSTLSSVSADSGTAAIANHKAVRYGSSTPEANSRIISAATLCDSLVTMDTARRLVEYYKLFMYPYYPIVYVAPACTADDLRQTRPILLLAILAGAAGSEHPELAAKLDRALLEEYANRTMLSSEKSLDLVQALLVSSSWYQPPIQLNRYKYLEYVHLASMMATDIGLTSRPLGGGFVEDATEQSYHGDSSEVQSMRTLLAILMKSVGTMITSRRAATMRVTSYARECLGRLDQSFEATVGDHVLAAWVRLLVIADEIGSAFSFDDPGATASVFDGKTHLMTAMFNKRLLEWRAEHAVFVESSVTLRMTYYTMRLYLHEPVLHVDHDPEDFKVPYRMSGANAKGTCAGPVPVKFAADSLMELMHSSQALLDAFTSLSAEETRALPLGMFVRGSYATFIMAKLCASAVDKCSQIAALIDCSALQAESYLDKTLLHLRDAIGDIGCRVPAIFVNLLCQMRTWCADVDCTKKLDCPPGTVAMDGLDSVPGGEASDGQGKTGLPVSPTALTETFEANYQRFGNAKVVKLAATQGRLGHCVGISDTVMQLEAAISIPSPTQHATTTGGLAGAFVQNVSENGALGVSGAMEEESLGPRHQTAVWREKNHYCSANELNSQDMLDLHAAYMENMELFIHDEPHGSDAL